MVTYSDYLQLLPKTELHCHFVSLMQPDTLLALAAKNGVTLPDRPLESNNLVDFLALFNAAHEVLVTPDDFAELAYDSVRQSVIDGNLRYREVYINPQNFFARGMSYAQVIDPIIAGLQAAETDFAVGFGLVIAINRSMSPAAASELVQQVVDHPRDAVYGIGQDDLASDGTESPELWGDAYDLAGRHGLKRTAHVGETMQADPQNIITALDVLHVDRIDHGYRAMDDPEVLKRLVDLQIPITCTPSSTQILSQWDPSPDHRIARMIDAGLNVTIATDDAVFFHTDIGREYRDWFPAMQIAPDAAKRVSLAGATSAWCEPTQRARLIAEFEAAHLGLDAVFEATSAPGRA
jgi:adenosine deaminase